MKAISLSLVALTAATVGTSCHSAKTSLVKASAPNTSASAVASIEKPAPTAKPERQVVRTSAPRTSRPARAGRKMTVRTTAYSCKEREKGGIYGNRNACGTQLRYGAVRSAAADWSRFPVGTKFRMTGQPQVYVVDDYGSALVGTSTIDIYKPTLGMMNDWGVRHVDIEVLEWGSLSRSAAILKARTHVSHTRTMYHAINAKLSGIATRSGAARASTGDRG